MGFESFQVLLVDGNLSYSEVHQAMRRLPGVRLDEESGFMSGATYYVAEGDQHVIEVELTHAPVRLSCHFMLCHPPSIDAAFLAFVRERMSTLGMKVAVVDDVPPEHPQPFSLARFEEFAAVTIRCIATQRAAWIAMMGTEQLAAKSRQVFERIILPHCQATSPPR